MCKGEYIIFLHKENIFFHDSFNEIHGQKFEDQLISIITIY